MKMIRTLIIILVLLALVSVGAWYGRDKFLAQPKEGLSEMLATAERRDLESNLLLTGEVAAVFQLPVKAEVGGKVKEIHIPVGKYVKKGDLLVTIDDTDLRNERETARTNMEGAQLSVEKAKGNFERAKSLFEQKLISREVFSNLQSDYEIAENNLAKTERSMQTVEDKLSKTQITAPGDGTVLSINVTEGQVVVAAASVNAGTDLMTFADLSRLMIKSHVNQVDAPRLALQQPVEVNMSDTTGEPVKAEIEFIAPLATVKNNIKGFEVQALIKDSDGRLKPGMSVSMNVPVGRVESAVSVPVTAVFKDRKDSIVYVQNGQSTEKRKVTVGLTNLSFVEIKDGVEEGEKILLTEPEAPHSKS